MCVTHVWSMQVLNPIVDYFHYFRNICEYSSVDMCCITYYAEAYVESVKFQLGEIKKQTHQKESKEVSLVLRFPQG